MPPFYPYISRRKFSVSNRAGGVNEDNTYIVKTEAIGKGKHDEAPYLIANEWIAANIAQFLRLPVPPFAVVRKQTRKTAMFTSFSYDGDTKPDDVEPTILYDTHPDLCTGIVLFDILIANCDRHAGNLKVDKPAKPTACYIIDHDRCMFYIYKDMGIERLRSRKDRLGITDGADSADEWHCLISLLDSSDLMGKWIHRIQDIPSWYIDGVCDDCIQFGITKKEATAAKQFLDCRTRGIEKLILSNKDRFPNIKQWPVLFR